MKIKFGLLVLAFLSALTPVFAQRKLKKVEPGEASKNRLAEIYADSLLMCRQRIDSMKMDSGIADMPSSLRRSPSIMSRQPACCDSSLRMG